MSHINDIPSALKDLAAAASTQARVANRYWLVLLVIGVFAAVPKKVSNGYIELPFKLGSIEEHDYVLLGLLMLTVIIIAFCSAHAQTLRVQEFIHRMLCKNSFGSMPGGHDGRDYFDALRHPAITRVAPRPQLARGKHQFFVDKDDVSQHRKSITLIYYLFLKLLSILIYFGLPVTALFIAVSRYATTTHCFEGYTWLVLPFVAGAVITLIQLIFYEIAHVLKASKAITSSNADNNS